MLLGTQRFRFCGDLEPPDWVLVEIPLLSGETKNTVRLVIFWEKNRVKALVVCVPMILTEPCGTSQLLRDLETMCRALGANINLQVRHCMRDTITIKRDSDPVYRSWS